MATLSKLNSIKVRDLKGKVHLLSRANASDMVQHNGWQLVFEADPTPDEEFAHAPRQKRPRDEAIIAGKAATGVAAQQGRAGIGGPVLDPSSHLANPMAQAMKEARALNDEDEDDEVDKPDNKPGRKPRRQSAVKETDGEDALAAVMPAVKAHAAKQASKDELLELEGDEASRTPKDE